MPEPGGGNPNYVENIVGTLANPWGNYNLRTDLIPKILSNEISMHITFTSSDVTYISFPNLGSVAATTHICSAYSATSDTARISLLRYSANGTLQSADAIKGLLLTGGQWSGANEAVDPATPCTLTIIHHPIPEN